MPDFKFNVGDAEYNVKDVPDVETAQKQLKAFRLQEVKEKQAADIEASPAWTKPFVAAHDLGRGSIDNLTLGGMSRLGDYFAGDDSVSLGTQAAKDRTGWAGTALDVATAAKYLPTVVPRVVGAVGGGPGVRALTAGTTAAAEGGTLGGVSAGFHDQDVTTGVGIGAGSGILGQMAGGLVNKGKRVWDELSIPAIGKVGKTFEAPTYNILKAPKGADPQTRVNVATSKAEQAAASKSDNPLALQEAYADKFSKLQASPGFKKDFNKAEREQIQKIISGDFGTNAARRVGDIVGNPMVAMGSATSMGGLPGFVLGATALSGGKALKSLSSGGTEEAVRDLRRAMYGVDKFKGPLSPEWIKRMRHGSRQLGQELYGE